MHWVIHYDLYQLGLLTMSKQVVVIDCGIGNVYSVCNALSHIGASPILSGDPTIIAKADRVILPGVGAFSKAMENLRKQGLDDAIAKFIEAGRPFLGICIGMQVLMENSTEFGYYTGLGHIKGSVDRISNILVSGSKVKVPHIGWDHVNIISSSFNKEINYIENNHGFFYFVHSYMCKPLSEVNVLATTSYYGNKINAIIGRDNIIGVQFHPERSGPAGLNFLINYIQH